LEGYWASLWFLAAADDATVLIKQATPKDPRVWAPLIHQTYPREAALAGLESSVRIRVVVDRAGRVSDCFVLQSSGHAILDQAACDGMRRFAVFNPAIDASGSPTVGSYATVITYRMRTPQPSPLPPIPPRRSAPTT
jgi:protein TonB